MKRPHHSRLAAVASSSSSPLPSVRFKWPIPVCVVAALLVAAAPVHANKAENDAAMLKLATSRGCMACHSIQAIPRRADGLPPIAPAWRDIALKYRDDPGASDRLKRVVLTGSDPRSRHWVGKVSEVAMPPNAGVVTEAEARVLVNWLLVLVP